MEENKIEKYYRLRNCINKKIYFFKNKHYQRIVKETFNKKKNKDKFNILRSFIKNLKDSVIVLLLIFIIEIMLKLIIQNINWKIINILKEHLTINQDMFSQFIICGIGVAGVFLALYYSNIATIYSSEYTNTISRIRKLFEYEISQNANLKKINTYIIQAVLILFSMMVGFPIWYIFVLYMIIKTIDIIITFIMNGNTIYEFSNIYNVLLNRKKQLVFHIDSVTEKGYLYNDFNFQNFHGKQALSILEDMRIVNNYILEEKDLNKKDSILEFAQKNISILGYYLCSKNRILYNSLWFQKKMEHKKWYSADFSEKGVALNTGTELQPTNIIDIDWFEINILRINEQAIIFLLNNGCIKEITYYIKAIGDIIPCWIKFGNIDLFYEHIKKIIIAIKNNSIDNNKDNDDILTLFEMICNIFIHYALCVREFIEEINLNECESFIKNNYKFTGNKIQQINNKVYNNAEFYSIYKALKNEKEIEGKIITPNWYLKQRVSKLYIVEINKLLDILEKIYDINLKLGMELLENSKYTYSAIFIINENELYNKVHLIPETCCAIFNELMNNDIEKDYKLPDIYIKNMMENIKRQHSEKVTKLWEKSCEVWGIKSKNNERDVFGFCYNNLCEYIFQNIIDFNYEVFAAHYGNLIKLALLSEIDIHDELMDDKLYTDITKLKFQLSGLNIMFELSGYAIIIGEILNDKRWKRKIDDEIEKLISKSDKINFIEQIRRWKNAIEWLVNDIRNIEIDGTNRKLRFRDTIEKANKLKFENIGPFGYKKIINTKNLEKLYYNDTSGISADMREIFAIACLNKYLDQKDIYQSRRIKIEKWEEMEDENEKKEK